MLPSSVMVLSTAGNSSRHSGGSLSESDDIFMTIDNDNGTEFFAVEPLRALSNNKESLQKEKQISVDPISLQGSIRQASFRLVKGSGPNPLVPLPPPKLKFVSASLPSSTSSSPTGGSNLLKKLRKNNNDQGNPVPSQSNLSRMLSAMDDSQLAMRESETRRSKSCGEARSSIPTMDDFDLWLEKSSDSRGEIINQRTHSNSTYTNSRGFSKPPQGPSGDQHMKKSKSRDPNFPEDGFKCGKLCLFLPRGKGKPVRSSSSTSTHVSKMTEGTVISRTVSLERFECGSWSPSGLNENEEGEATNLFFDLPMEMLRCSVSDMQSPVTAAFVFEDDDSNNNNNKESKEPKGVLKSSSSTTSSRKSMHDSSRHVRFSTSSPTSNSSSPTCITPRLRQAREDFNAFLEAHST